MKNDTDFQIEYAAARRAYIEKEFRNLNEMQRKAVLATEGPLLILAGAGSGKTTVLINRIANLLRFGSASDSVWIPDNADETMLQALRENSLDALPFAQVQPVEPWRILAITFTNKAADELKFRLTQMLGEKAADIWACTFHSACVRMLRRNADILGYSDDFTIYDTSDCQSLLKRILKDFDLDDKIYPPRSVLSAISKAKDIPVSAEEYLQEARKFGDARRIRIGEIYQEYTRRMFAANAMDFDDLLLNSVHMLQQNEEILSFWQRRFRYIMIDEYQDTNHLQFLLASLLADKHHNICVVGDDDQSIYRFRGATIENILSFEERNRNCRTIRLEQNYRSTEHILSAANSVIRNNTERKGKELWTKAGAGDPIVNYTVSDENEEANTVASLLLADYSSGVPWRDHAVLYRMNAQSSQLEFALKRVGIPYQVFGSTRFFDRAEVKDVLSYLSVIVSPSDDLRLLRIINNPPRGIGEKSIETARAIAMEENCSLYDVISRADRYPSLSRPSLRMREFANMLRDLHQFASENPSDAVFDEVIKKTGYLDMLQNSNDEKDVSRAENVMELKSSILGYKKENEDPSLSGYLANIALYTDLDAFDRDSDCVVMMTMHSAKGLEFPSVYVVGMEEGIFPGTRAIGEQEEMEEERRLCYVAITRAKKHLCFFHARQRMLFGHTTANMSSRFLDEIPALDMIQKDIGSRNSRYSEYGSKYDQAPSYGYKGGSEKSFSHSYSGFRTDRPAGSPSFIRKPNSPVKSSDPLPELSLGGSVRHKTFGEGVVVKMTPMGNDCLLDIHFSGVGTKKLMLRAASRFLEKI